MKQYFFLGRFLHEMAEPWTLGPPALGPPLTSSDHEPLLGPWCFLETGPNVPWALGRLLGAWGLGPLPGAWAPTLLPGALAPLPGAPGDPVGGNATPTGAHVEPVGGKFAPKRPHGAQGPFSPYLHPISCIDFFVGPVGVRCGVALKSVLHWHW